MKSLRNHFSVIFPLVFLLFSFEFTIFLTNIVEQYEKKVVDEYNIIMVATDEVDSEALIRQIPQISTISNIDTGMILDKLKGNISSQNISLLELALPKFYSVKLHSFPNLSVITEIKRKLESDKNITKVEAYFKTFDQIYKLLLIIKSISVVFAGFVLVVSLLLMLKQMRIWVLEHKERMDIMSFFGAPFWMKSTVLYRLAIVDSIISTFIVSAIFYFAPFYPQLIELASELDMVIPRIDLLKDSGLLFGISLFFALISVTMVMVKVKGEK